MNVGPNTAGHKNGHEWPCQCQLGDAVADPVPRDLIMPWQQSVTLARDRAAETLAEILASPKPSYNVHGQNYSWTEYAAMLNTQIAESNKLLSQEEPFEKVSTGR